MTYESTYFLVSLADIKTRLGITGDAQDDELGVYSNIVTEMLEHACNRGLAVREYTETYAGSGKGWLFLRNYPVVSDTATIDVRVDTAREFGDDSIVDADDLTIIQSTGKLYYNRYAVGNDVIQATYSAGYSIVPYDLQEAAYELAAILWKRNKDKSWDVSGDSIGDRSLTISISEWPLSVRDAVRYYRRAAHG